MGGSQTSTLDEAAPMTPVILTRSCALAGQIEVAFGT